VNEGVCAFLLSLVFYKICTKILHKLYVELRFALVCMECRELHHNRHAVSLMTDRMVVLPKDLRPTVLGDPHIWRCIPRCI